MPTNREIYFQLLNENHKYLNKNVIISLLADANGVDDRIVLYENFDKEAPNYNALLNKIDLVKSGMPYQYVLGYTYFLGQKIIVNKDVLIPRQETEQLTVDTIVYLRKTMKQNDAPVIADVCTGSGAIACALKKAIPNAKVYGTDISLYALKVAKKNAKNVEFLCGNLLQPLIDNKVKLDVLVCNPPYIENIKNIDKQVWDYEPHLALVASPATKCYEEIFKNAEKVMKEQYIMAFEIEEDMEKPLIELMNKYLIGCTYCFRKDIYDKTRFLYIIK